MPTPGESLAAQVNKDLSRSRLEREALSGVQGGFDRVNSTAPVVGDYRAVTALKDTTFTSLVADNCTNTAGLLLPAGATLSARITGFTLATGGDVVAYKI